MIRFVLLQMFGYTAGVLIAFGLLGEGWWLVPAGAGSFLVMHAVIDRLYRRRWYKRWGYYPRAFPWPYIARPCPHCGDRDCPSCEPDALAARMERIMRLRARRGHPIDWN